jgi:hypothetical protein
VTGGREIRCRKESWINGGLFGGSAEELPNTAKISIYQKLMLILNEDKEG